MSKTLVTALSMILISGISCKKDAELSPDLNGLWELRTAEGGLFGRREFEPGNGNTYRFNNNNYTQNIKSTDTTYIYSGTFSVHKGKPCELSKENTLIQFDNNQMANIFTHVNGKIIIGSPHECIFDGVDATYIKIQD